MTEQEKVNLLLENGFEVKEQDDGCVYIKALNRDRDRFQTDLYVYHDSLDEVYINSYLIKGLKTVSEQRVLEDHNELNTSTKEDYVKTMSQLSFLKSVL